MKIHRAIVAAAALLIPVTAATAQDLRIRVGLGAQVRPDYLGSDSYEITPAPAFSFARSGEPFGLGAPDDGFGIKLFSSGGFSVGPVASLSQDRKDSDVGAPVGDVSRAIELGGFVQHQISDSFRVRGELRQALGGHDGLRGFVGADYFTRDADKYTFSIGPRARFGSADFMDSYFGVNPGIVTPVAVPAYEPDGGLYAVGATSGFTYSLGGAIGLFGFARYDRLVGDAKDSPIVRQFGSPDQFSAGLGLSYTFNINL